MTDILIDRVDTTAIVTLNRLEAMNALSRAMRRDLAQALAALEADDRVRVIILTGAGTRAFTAGLDLRELATDPEGLAAANATSVEENPARAVEACRKPVIGAINGVAITGGFELALATDVMIASSNARFADTHGRVGVMPGWGLSQKLSRIVGAGRAKRLSFTGNFIDAVTAERWGLVTEVVEPERLLPAAIGLAQDMAGIAPDFLAAYKSLIDDGFALTFEAGMALEHGRSSEWNAKLTPDEIARRREAVQARGRTQ